MSLKINSGWCKGISLRIPAGSLTRPTASRAREGIWNSCGGWLQDAKIIDIFCGSGAVGIEAISRGAKSCTFIDQSRPAIACLRANIRAVEHRSQGLHRKPPQMSVYALDWQECLAKLSAERFDIVWLDPPYNSVVDMVRQEQAQLTNLVASDGLLIIESDSQAAKILSLEVPTQQLNLFRQKKYGKSHFTIFRKQKDDGN